MDGSDASLVIAVHPDCMMRFRNEVIYLLGETPLESSQHRMGSRTRVPKTTNRTPAAAEQRLCDSDESYPTRVPAPDVTSWHQRLLINFFFCPMSYLPPTFLDGSFDRHVQLPSSDELYQRWELNSLLLLLRVGSSNDGLRDAKSAR